MDKTFTVYVPLTPTGGIEVTLHKGWCMVLIVAVCARILTR